jgi:hypothetical protein
MGGKKHSLDMMQFGLAGATHLFDKQKFAQEMDLHRSELNLAINQALKSSYGEVYERARARMNDPNSSNQEKTAAAIQMNEATNATNGLTVPIKDPSTGKVVKTLHFGAGELTTDRFLNVMGTSNYLWGRPSIVLKNDRINEALKGQYGTKNEGLHNIADAIMKQLEQDEPSMTKQEREAIGESVMQQAYRWMPQGSNSLGESTSKAFH